MNVYEWIQAGKRLDQYVAEKFSMCRTPQEKRDFVNTMLDDDQYFTLRGEVSPFHEDPRQLLDDPSVQVPVVGAVFAHLQVEIITSCLAGLGDRDPREDTVQELLRQLVANLGRKPDLKKAAEAHKVAEAACQKRLAAARKSNSSINFALRKEK